MFLPTITTAKRRANGLFRRYQRRRLNEPSRLSATSKLQAPVNVDLNVRLYLSSTGISLIINTGRNTCLTLVGAGATAVVDRDWRQVWVDSKECQILEEINYSNFTKDDHIYQSQQRLRSSLHTPWTYRTRTLLQRQNLALNLLARVPHVKSAFKHCRGAFFKFYFFKSIFKSNDTVQGSQNKLFVCILLIPQLLAPYST